MGGKCIWKLLTFETADQSKCLDSFLFFIYEVPLFIFSSTLKKNAFVRQTCYTLFSLFLLYCAGVFCVTKIFFRSGGEGECMHLVWSLFADVLDAFLSFQAAVRLECTVYFITLTLLCWTTKCMFCWCVCACLCLPACLNLLCTCLPAWLIRDVASEKRS